MAAAAPPSAAVTPASALFAIEGSGSLSIVDSLALADSTSLSTFFDGLKVVAIGGCRRAALLPDDCGRRQRLRGGRGAVSQLTVGGDSFCLFRVRQRRQFARWPRSTSGSASLLAGQRDLWRSAARRRHRFSCASAIVSRFRTSKNLHSMRLQILRFASVRLPSHHKHERKFIAHRQQQQQQTRRRPPIFVAARLLSFLFWPA